MSETVTVTEKRTLAQVIYHWEEYDITAKTFPKWLPGTNFGKMKLLGLQSAEGIEVWAAYSTKEIMGFMHGLYIERVAHKARPEKKLWQVQHLSGNTWGHGTWLIIRTDYFRTLEDAFDNLHGRETYKPPRCRKLRVPEGMTVDEIAQYLEMSKEELQV